MKRGRETNSEGKDSEVAAVRRAEDRLVLENERMKCEASTSLIRWLTVVEAE